MRRAAQAALLCLVMLMSSQVAVPVQAATPNVPFVVQQWDSGVWVAWDRGSVQTVAVSMRREVAGTSGLMRTVFVDDFTFVPFQAGARLPFAGTFLLSLITVNASLNDLKAVPVCTPFTTVKEGPAGFPGGRPFFDQVCGSETVYRIAVDLPAVKSASITSSGRFVGVRNVNPRTTGDSRCLGCDGPLPLDISTADVVVARFKQQRLTPTARRVLVADSLHHGLPKNADLFLEVRSVDPKTKAARWSQVQGIGAVGTSSSLTAFTIPLWLPVSTKYRFTVWRNDLRKTVFTGREFSIQSALRSLYGVRDIGSRTLVPLSHVTALSEQVQ
jgi:hypothetical protein